MDHKRNQYVDLMSGEIVYSDDPYMVKLIKQLNKTKSSKKSGFSLPFLFF